MPPVRLIPTSDRALAIRRERARTNTPLKTIQVQSPWLLYVPDIDPHRAPASAASLLQGLIAKPDPGGYGEVLRPDQGWDLLDSARLPLGADANTTRSLTLLAQFPRTNSAGAITGEYDKTLLATSAGDASNAGSLEVWRLRPSTGQWQEIAHSGAAGTTAPSGNRDQLFDWTVMPAGAPARASHSGAINEPAFVFTNGFDPVYVYPVDTGGGTSSGAFEDLTDTSATWPGGPSDPFKAITVESFAGRLYFGNTTEGGTRYRQRVRRTGLFTADPLPTATGAGAFDIRDFSRDLLRLEKLGDLLVAYYGDGVAFIRKTDIAGAPDTVDVLRDRRGLLSTHALVAVGDDRHFGIFDDGWWFLDPSGRWTEAGVMSIDGILHHKWKQTFYSKLNYDKRNRLVVAYDGDYIRISLPVLDQDENSEVWIYDPKTDRVSVDPYEVTVFGTADRQIRASTTWAATVGTWSSISGSWASFAAEFGALALLHGDSGGYVFLHDPDLITRYAVASAGPIYPNWIYQSPRSALGSPRYRKCADRMWMEHIQASAGSSAGVFGIFGETGAGETYVVDFSGGSNGSLRVVSQTVHFSSTHLMFRASGAAPILIHSFEIDYFDDLGETREA